MNVRLAGEEIAYVLADSGASAVIVDEALEPSVAQARSKAPSLHTVVTIGADLEQMLCAADADLPHARVVTARPTRGECWRAAHASAGATAAGRGAHATPPTAGHARRG